VLSVTSRHNARIVSALISLSHALGLEVVAEGVEDEAHIAKLTELGCDIAQGYLFGKALPAGDITTFLGSSGRMLDVRGSFEH
jgi:diguanylate cyclase